MEYRLLGGSGLKVPVLSFGTATFGGQSGTFFGAWGSSDVDDATRLVDICLDVGANLFDTADSYSRGVSEEILGKAIAGKRDRLLISTKATSRMGEDINERGSSRFHLIKACEASLRRLGTDYIDIYTMHTFDAMTPIEEVLSTLETLVQSGKVRYIACSNFSGWHLMKSLAISEKYGWSRYVAHQAYYSLIGREYEWELMPLAIDQKVGTLVWSPLGGGRLSGKIRPGQPAPADTRIAQIGGEGTPPLENIFKRVIQAVEDVAQETGRPFPQVALNWLLTRPTVCSLVIGARNEQQLRDNLGAVEWALTQEQVAKLDEASEIPPTYPYWHQRGSMDRNPLPVATYLKR